MQECHITVSSLKNALLSNCVQGSVEIGANSRFKRIVHRSSSQSLDLDPVVSVPFRFGKQRLVLQPGFFEGM